MIVEPKIRGFICTTAHPEGCHENVRRQMAYVKEQGGVQNGPKKVLVIGASTGYGLASRITAAFGSNASTIGVVFERPSDGKRTATAGWYNTVAFEKEAKAAGLYSKTINGDAFSDEVKAQVVDLIKNDWQGEVDLIVYSVASPRRTHPKTGETFKSTLKPTGGEYTNKSIDFSSNEIIEVTLPPASQEEVDHTVAVMGGEDWAMWTDLLMSEGLLSDNALNIAYSYIGPEVTTAVYRNGTIGAAKDHLEATAHSLDEKMKQSGGRAFVSVNKALVTQSSSAIPFIPLYFILLMKVMKEKGIHEDCIAQIQRLFTDRLYNDRDLADVPVDDKGRIRIDDWELREDVQKEVDEKWNNVSNETIHNISDLEGYNQDFLNLFGFGFDNVDYQADVTIDQGIE